MRDGPLILTLVFATIVFIALMFTSGGVGAMDIPNSGIIDDEVNPFPLESPLGGFIHFPSEGQFLNSSEVIANWSEAEVGFEVDHYELRIDGGSWWVLGNETSCTLPPLSDGDHSCLIRAFNSTGGYSEDYVSFVVDTDSPTIEITDPLDGQAFNTSEVILRWNASDDGSGIDHFEISINGEESIGIGVVEEFDLPPLADNAYEVILKAFDRAGNWNLGQVNFIVDVEGPSVEIAAPLDSSYINRSHFNITWSGHSPVSNIDHYSIRIDTRSWMIPGSQDSFAVPPLAEGEHELEVVLFDSAGNRANQTIHFVVDTFDPSVSILTPLDGTMFNRTNVVTSWNGSDLTSGICLYRMQVDDSDWVSVEMNTTFSLPFLADGWHLLRITAIDRAGNQQMDLISFAVDTRPPTIEIIQPENGSWTNYAFILVTWEALDDGTGIHFFDMKLDDQNWQTIGVNGSILLTGLEDGHHELTIRTWDFIGFSANDTVCFTIETITPFIEITSPDQDEIFNITNITVEWEAFDNDTGLRNFEFRIDGQRWIDNGLQMSTSFQNLSDGQHLVEVVAYNNATRDAQASVYFTIDTLAPEIQIVNPANGTMWSTGTLTLDLIAVDPNGTGVESCVISIDGGNWTDVGLNGHHDLPMLQDGTHIITLMASDAAGNSKSVNTTFHIDTLPPELAIVSPKNGTYMNSNQVLVEWEITELGSGFGQCMICCDRCVPIEVGNSSFLMDLTEGQHVVKLTAYDLCGNNCSKTVNLTIDTIAPSIRIITPAMGTVLENASFSVAWIGNDSIGISRYEIKTGDGVWISMGMSEGYSVLPKAYGNLTITVRAVDFAGNTNSDLIIVNIQPEEPPVDFISEFWWVLAIIGAVIVATFLLIMLRRRVSE